MIDGAPKRPPGERSATLTTRRAPLARAIHASRPVPSEPTAKRGQERDVVGRDRARGAERRPVGRAEGDREAVAARRRRSPGEDQRRDRAARVRQTRSVSRGSVRSAPNAAAPGASDGAARAASCSPCRCRPGSPSRRRPSRRRSRRPRGRGRRCAGPRSSSGRVHVAAVAGTATASVAAAATMAARERCERMRRERAAGARGCGRKTAAGPSMRVPPHAGLTSRHVGRRRSSFDRRRLAGGRATHCPA